MNFSPKRSLETRLTRHFAGFVAVAMLLITVTTTVVVTSLLRGDLRDDHLKDAMHNLDGLEQRLAYLTADVKRFSRNHFVVNGLIDASGRERYLPSLVRDFGSQSVITRVTIVDFLGNPIVSSPDSPMSFQDSPAGHSVLSVGNSGLWMVEDVPGRIRVAEPVEYYQTPVGAVIVDVDLPALTASMLQSGQAGYEKIYAEAREVFTNHYDSSESYIRYRLSAGKNHPLLQSLKIEIEGGVSKDVYLKPIYRITFLLAGIGLLFTAAAVFLSRRMGRSISRPVRELCDRVGRAEKEPVRCSPLGTDDEMEMLARAFDRRADGLIAAEENYRYLFEKNPQPVWVYDLESLRFMEVNEAAVNLYGYSQDEFLRMTMTDIRPSEDVSALLANVQQVADGFDKAGIWRHCRKDGTVIMVEITSHALVFQGRRAELVLAIDVTKKVLAEQALQRSEREKSALLNSLPDIAWLKDAESRFIAVNRAFAEAAGCSPEFLVGKTDFDVWPTELAERYCRDDRDVVTAGKMKRTEEPLVDSHGTKTWIESIKVPFHNERGEVTGTVGIARDISDRKRYEEQLSHQANHDALTDLPNRNLLADRLQQAIAHAERSGNRAAVLLFDLDRFKVVNDSLGHARGDELLQQFARRIQENLREVDTLARLGGDEFVLVLTEVEESVHISKAVERIRTSLSEPFEISGREIQVTVSIGVSVFPQDGVDSETLVRNADAAMYEAKREGRDFVRFFQSDMDSGAQETLTLEAELRRAIAKNELVLHYQPKVETTSGKIIGCEALIRWHHATRGLISPGLFIPLAEQSDLINSIGSWVLREACDQNKAWQNEGLPPIPVAVNLSARQFRQGNLIDTVEDILRESKLDSSWLELEITETMVMGNPERSIQIMQSLRAIGLRLALDDFGTGFSSLNYLRRFPIDTLKIDRSFIAEIPGSPSSEAVASGIFNISKSLKIDAVAEGVETEAQLDFLREHRCGVYQGFLFSRPVPAREFERLLKRQCRNGASPGCTGSDRKRR